MYPTSANSRQFVASPGFFGIGANFSAKRSYTQLYGLVAMIALPTVVIGVMGAGHAHAAVGGPRLTPVCRPLNAVFICHTFLRRPSVGAARLDKTGILPEVRADLLRRILAARALARIFNSCLRASERCQQNRRSNRDGEGGHRDGGEYRAFHVSP
jgi:hypothetical protein